MNIVFLVKVKIGYIFVRMRKKFTEVMNLFSNSSKLFEIFEAEYVRIADVLDIIVDIAVCNQF